MEFNDKLDHLSTWLKHRVDIMCHNPKRWMSYTTKDGYFNTSYYNLPTFEYYLKNCVQDKGGAYDFTMRRYKTLEAKASVIESANFQNIIGEYKTASHLFKYSNWMGTAFNFKQVKK